MLNWYRSIEHIMQSFVFGHFQIKVKIFIITLESLKQLAAEVEGYEAIHEKHPDKKTANNDRSRNKSLL